MNPYQPGSHVIATLDCANPDQLYQYSAYKSLMDSLIAKYNLNKLGEVYHNFAPAGFTGVICLSESHLSIHTWPEYGKINLDIYLSNYEKDNDGTVTALFNDIIAFFRGTVSDFQKLKR